MPRRSLLVLVALVACALGCTWTRYLAQAAGGQVEILAARRPLDEVVVDPSVPPRVRRLLAEVPRIKQFGETHGLEATPNYQTYVDLRRPAVVWVVSATEELSFTPKKWSFPIVGSVPYLGWFARADAERFAWDLREEGWEVDVRTASAFSTLGWFEDPVLSTMIHDGPEDFGELVDVVLHESMHATHYVDGQTAFDESIANFVGDKLALRYLAEVKGPDAAETRAFVQHEEGRARRIGLLRAAYRELSRLYASELPDAVKRVEKALVLSRVRNEIGARRPINNATLFELESYRGGEEELERLLWACGGSFPRLVAALRRVTKASFVRPQQRDLAPVIRPLVSQGC
jgi:predicted aminopeptidase